MGNRKMTYRDFIAMAVERLAPIYGADEARAAASALLCHYLGIQPYKIVAEPETVISAGAVSGASGVSGVSGGAGASGAGVSASGAGVSASGGADASGAGVSDSGGVDASGAGVSAFGGAGASGVGVSDSGGAVEALLEALARMEEGCPLQYMLGFTEFCGMKVRVSPGCLIPRPETEEMVSMILDTFDPPVPEGEPFNILDLCTGSGCIAYALARAFPEAQVFGCDVSMAALDVACRQRIKVGGARPVFFQADILQAPPAGLPKFSLIVSNPPYVMESERAQMRRNVLDYEPSEALFVPDDDPLRFYTAIRSWASALLLPGGEIWMEINERLGAETAAVFGEAGAPEAGVPEVGAPEMGVPEMGVPKAGVPEAGVPETGISEAGVPETGVPKAGISEAGVLETGISGVGVGAAGASSAHRPTVPGASAHCFVASAHRPTVPAHCSATSAVEVLRDLSGKDRFLRVR